MIYRSPFLTTLSIGDIVVNQHVTTDLGELMNKRRTTRIALAVSLVCAATAWGAQSSAATTVPGTEPPGTDAGAPPGRPSRAPSQQVAGTSGDLCTYEDLRRRGVEQVDLASATIGFAQSEREANPFRIAETQSIRDEAEARGIDLIVTNAESDLNKEISDIQGMVDQGVDALIISPLNSEGLDPAFDYAKENGVPIMTIDRLLTTMTACEDYIGWIGSDFVEQGRRAADAMVRETGGEGRLAVLLGAPGVNVTTDRNNGFMERLEELDTEHRGCRRAGGELRAGDGPDGHRAVDRQRSGHHGDLRPQRRDGPRRGRRAASRRVLARRRQDHHDRRHAGSGAGHHRRLDLRCDRVQSAFRAARLPGARGLLQRRRRPEVTIISDKEYTVDNAEAELENAY